MFGTSLAWISSSVFYFWRDIDLQETLCFLRKELPASWAFYPGRLKSSATPLSEPQISNLQQKLSTLRDSFIIKQTKRTNFTNLSWHETLHVSDSSSTHHQEFIHCTLGNAICHTGLKTAFEQDQDGNADPSWYCSKAVYTPVWHIPLPSVQWINSWWWAEDLPETCRVSCQTRFTKLVRLVGFIIKTFFSGLWFFIMNHFLVVCLLCVQKFASRPL
jgi:hypothetical protein